MVISNKTDNVIIGIQFDPTSSREGRNFVFKRGIGVNYERTTPFMSSLLGIE